jgi:hypothetical protein
MDASPYTSALTPAAPAADDSCEAEITPVFRPKPARDRLSLIAQASGNTALAKRPGR